MKRKPPYRHPVKGHTRSGIRVHRYERGKGNPPRISSRMRGSIPSNLGYSVTLYFDKGSETHRVPARTITDAAKQGIQSIQTPSIPRRMRIKREDN